MAGNEYNREYSVESSRSKKKAVEQQYKSLHFLLEWIDEVNVYDVISAKDVRAEENVLNLVPGMPCQGLYNGAFFDAKIISCGSYMDVKRLQGVLEKKAKASEQKADNKQAQVPSKPDDMAKGCEHVSQTQDVILEASNSDSREMYRFQEPGTAKSRKRKRALMIPSDSADSESDDGSQSPPIRIRKSPKAGDVFNDLAGVDIPSPLVGTVTKLTERVRKMEKKMKKFEKQINRMRNSSVTSAKPPTPTRPVTPNCKLEVKKEVPTQAGHHNVVISGKTFDGLRLAAAKLHGHPATVGLKLMECLFSTAELVNGNPSGVTKSLDPDRIATIKKLDEARMKYIYDELEKIQPGSSEDKLIKRKLTQKCTDAYNNPKNVHLKHLDNE